MPHPSAATTRSGVARGVATPGHPQLWVRRGDRIYLFHKEETRAAFIADPAYALAAADGRWPAGDERPGPNKALRRDHRARIAPGDESGNAGNPHRAVS